MSSLSFIEQRNFEKLFEMHTGYVMDFSNRTFGDFVIDSIGLNPYEGDYDSKANLLRRIIEKESNFKVGKLLFDMVEFFEMENGDKECLNISLINKCKEIALNLKNNSDILDINIENIDQDKTLDLLLSEIENAKEKENPEIILDRLHTLSVKYIKKLGNKYGINVEGKSLNASFGLYIKDLEKNGVIESEMTLLIFRSNISVLEKFNYIRNNQSLAHDNQILNSNESILIINNIINLLHFIDKIENQKKEQEITNDEEISIDDIPF